MISLFIDNTDRQVDLASGENYQNFLNEVADLGGCPHLLRFIPQYSSGVWGKLDKPSDNNQIISLDILKQEIARILLAEISEQSRYIAEKYRDCLEEAEKLSESVIIE